MFNVKYTDFVLAVEQIKKDMLINTDTQTVEFIINGDELFAIGINQKGNRKFKTYKLKDYIKDMN